MLHDSVCDGRKLSVPALSIQSPSTRNSDPGQRPNHINMTASRAQGHSRLGLEGPPSKNGGLRNRILLIKLWVFTPPC